MPKQLSLILLLLTFSFPAFCQVKEIIDRDIKLITHVPDFCNTKSRSELKRLWRRFRKDNPQYSEIVSLDTVAIPYLIDKISDTTTTSVILNCTTVIPYNLKTGDIAFELFNRIIKLIPMHAVTGLQWDYFSCGLCDYIYLLKDNRLKFQTQLRTYFLGPKGKVWIRLLKTKKLSPEEHDKLIKEL